jgi:hypothetical protein
LSPIGLRHLLPLLHFCFFFVFYSYLNICFPCCLCWPWPEACEACEVANAQVKIRQKFTGQGPEVANAKACEVRKNKNKTKKKTKNAKEAKRSNKNKTNKKRKSNSKNEMNFCLIFTSLSHLFACELQLCIIMCLCLGAQAKRNANICFPRL